MLESARVLITRFIPDRWLTRVVAASVALIVLLAVFAFVWIVGIAGRADTLANELRASVGLTQTSDGLTDADAMADLRVQLDASAPRVQKLNDDLWPLRSLGSVAGWVPFLGDNITAAPNLADRLEDDVEAARGMVKAAERLIRVYDQIPQDANGITGALSALPSTDQVQEVRTIALSADRDLARAESTAGEINKTRIWWKLGARAEELEAQEAKMREFIDWMLLATNSLSALVALGDTANDLTALLDTGDSSQLTGDNLRRMPELELAAARAYESVSIAVTTAPVAISESSIGINLRDLEPVLNTLHATAGSGSLVSAIVIPAFETVESAGGGLFGVNSGLLDSVETIGLRVSELQDSQVTLRRSRSRLETAIPTIESAAVRSAAESLLSLSRELELAVDLLSYLPDLAPEALGANGERNYLMLAESADELRAAGGFVSGAWIITFDGGSLVSTTYLDIEEVDDLTKLSEYPAPPELLANHMDASAWLLRDVSWEPDFPSVARSAAEILSLGQDGLQVDGVVAMTQWAMLDLAEPLSPINTPGGPLSSDALLNALESGTDAEGREFMDTLFQGILSQVSGPSIDGKLLQMASAASGTMTEKQVLVHIFDQDQQDVIELAGWAGISSGGPGDRVMPVDSNVGWSKVDRNIERTLVYEVTLSPDSPSTGVSTVSYENQSGDDARSCNRQSKERDGTYEELKNACYWNLLRMYVADGSSLVSAIAPPLHGNSIYVERGLGAAGDDSVSVGFGPGGRFVSALLMVPAGQSVGATFVHDLPATAVDWTASDPTYTLSLYAQPGVRGRATTVQVHLPEGYDYTGGSVSPTSNLGNSVTFELPMREDTIVSVVMRRTSETSSP
jgi:hypothetical protein